MIRLPRDLNTDKFNSEVNNLFNVGNPQVLYVVRNISKSGKKNV